MPCRQDSHRRFIEIGGGGQRPSLVKSGRREKRGRDWREKKKRERCGKWERLAF